MRRRGVVTMAGLLLLGLAGLPGMGRGADPAVGGVDARTEAAVDRALEYLASKQTANGCFSSDGMANKNVAIHSLAVMAFLARGHVPGQGAYGDRLNRAVDWLLAQQMKDSGLISVNSGNFSMYDHGISTVMLCEVYGMVDPGRQAKVQEAVAKAVRLILNAQKVPKDQQARGGWRYGPTSKDADISVTGWQLMALRGAANVGGAIPKQALEDGVAYVRRLAASSGGFGYEGPESPSPGRTGTGILSLELLGQHLSKEAVAGGDYLLRNPPQSNQRDFYYYGVYYCSQAANQLGGKYYTGIYLPLRDHLLKQQSSRDGSFAASVGNEGMGSDVYSTSMAVLALCVPYRYLPLYQR